MDIHSVSAAGALAGTSLGDIQPLAPVVWHWPPAAQAVGIEMSAAAGAGVAVRGSAGGSAGDPGNDSERNAPETLYGSVMRSHERETYSVRHTSRNCKSSIGSVARC